MERREKKKNNDAPFGNEFQDLDHLEVLCNRCFFLLKEKSQIFFNPFSWISFPSSKISLPSQTSENLGGTRGSFCLQVKKKNQTKSKKKPAKCQRLFMRFCIDDGIYQVLYDTGVCVCVFVCSNQNIALPHTLIISFANL